jgi:uncharacterized protein
MMVTASFRFYAGLNDFLSPAHRQRSVAAPCARQATSKHMIEALGVPHTEVGLLLINGEAASLERVLRDGDRLAIYPAFSTLDIGALRALPPLPEHIRFVADVHLGGLARMLRMAGYDTVYEATLHDAEIAACAAREQRIVLTRDRELLKRSEVTHGCYVRALKPVLQLQEIDGRIGLAAQARPFTLCLRCNTPLHAVDKQRVHAMLPPSVRESRHSFQQCDRCQGIFWEGSHWEKMRGTLAAIGIAA